MLKEQHLGLECELSEFPRLHVIELHQIHAIKQSDQPPETRFFVQIDTVEESRSQKVHSLHVADTRRILQADDIEHSSELLEVLRILKDAQVRVGSLQILLNLTIVFKLGHILALMRKEASVVEFENSK